ncbi:MAG: hypothetical protein AAGD28_14510 [Bacteroidota bacterium]
MPANAKYLTTSKWQRFAKISAGFIGGFLVSAAFHVVLAGWIGRPNVIITSAFTSFLLWAGLMIIAFLSHNGWKIWLQYLLIFFILSALAYVTKADSLFNS